MNKTLARRTLAAIVVIGMIALSGCLMGCKTTDVGFTPGELEVLIRGAERAIGNYIDAVVDDPTPEQQLGLDTMKILIELAIMKVREAGAIEEAARLDKMLPPE